MFRLLRFAAVLLILSAGYLSAGQVLPGLTNGGFETGDLSAWSSAGTAGAIGGSGVIAPPFGAFQGALCSGNGGGGEEPAGPVADVGGCPGVPVADLELLLNLAAGSLAATFPDLGEPTFGSAIWQTFYANEGDSLTFHWNFLTDEEIGSGYDGAFFTLQRGSDPAQAWFLADTTSEDLTEDTEFSSGFAAYTGYFTSGIDFEESGQYTLGFGVIQTWDDQVESALLVDAGTESAVPEPSSMLLFASAAGCLLFLRRRLA